MEAFKRALAFLAEAESHRGGLVIKTCFDMACGHGLVGVLFARTPSRKTARACDWARRPAFDAYARVFGALAACEAKGARFDYRAWECANASRIDAALEALARDKEATEETLRMKDERDAPDVRRETKDPKSSARRSRTGFCAFSTRRYRANLWETCVSLRVTSFPSNRS